MALRCERQAFGSCVMWPTASPVLHLMRGFVMVHYMLAAYTMHKIFLPMKQATPICHTVAARADLLKACFKSLL